MKRNVLHLLIISVSATLLLNSCKKVTADASSGNRRPIANAGADRTIYWRGDTIHLNGSGSDIDGSISIYRWLKLSGIDYLPNKINDPSQAKTYITQLNPGTHQFQLTVTDDKGAEAKDVLDITIIDTVTTTGKEYLFRDLMWQENEDIPNHIQISVSSELLFYNLYKSIEVSFLLASSTSWQTVQKANLGTSKGSLNYRMGGGYLTINQEGSGSAANLLGTKASVRVRFL